MGSNSIFVSALLSSIHDSVLALIERLIKGMETGSKWYSRERGKQCQEGLKWCIQIALGVRG
jgi:hypothetical protein